MAINKGVAPPDMTSDVGRLRAVLGDLEYVALTPPEPGLGSYKLFGDAELEAFLETSGSVEGSASLAYLQLAASAAFESRNVKDQDLQIDLTKRATDFRLIAQEWQDRADAAAADVFEMFDTVTSECSCVPEATPRPACRRGCSGLRLF